jgi:radical SAM superfamily enzyme YgiQ (UPF0313 family)
MGGKSMKLALVYPPFYHKLFNENLATVDDEFGIFPYISFGHVARVAREGGFEVRLFDAANSGASYATALAEITSFDPDLLALPTHSAQVFRDVLDWATRLKDDTGLPILTGGYECDFYPQEIMTHRGFDYLCKGAVEVFMEPFARAFERGAGYEKVPNLFFKREGETVFTHEVAGPGFADLAIPDRSIFDHTLFRSHVSQRKNFTIGMSSLGCPHGCSFCCMSKTAYSARAPEHVLEEIEGCVTDHGIHEIDWFDPVMFQRKERVRELAEELAARRLDLIWSARTRLEPLTTSSRGGRPDERFIRTLSESGCRRLFIGIEAASETILDGVHKNLKVSDLHDVLACLREHGIMSLGFFMIGNPGETEATALETIDFARTVDLDYAQFSMTTMKPHTELTARYVREATGRDYWRDHVLGEVEEQILPSPWTELSRDDIERLAKRGYLAFYLRPRYILRMLRKTRSLEELEKYLRVALQMVLRPVATPAGETPAGARRYRRFVLALVEASLARLNRRGKRHSVHAFGSGPLAALEIALEELRRER